MNREFTGALVRYSALVVLAALAVGSALADDNDKLQGTWRIAKAKVGKAGVKGAQAQDMQVVIEGDKFTLVTTKRESVHFATNTAVKPHQIDFFKTSAKKEKVWHGIYEFDGDTLKLCWGPAGHARPSRFATNVKTENRNYTLKK
jgi:uncharacterized protein (TIGR03067 family)